MMTPKASELPIHFAISAPRSGSQWLVKALNGHPDIFATENRLFGRFCDLWPNNSGRMAPRITFDEFARAFSVHFSHEELGMNRQIFLKAFQKAFFNFLVNFSLNRSEKNLIVDKVTPYLGTSNAVVSGIRQNFPKAKVIELIRDGRDVAVSGAFDSLMKDSPGTDRYAYFVEQRPNVTLKRFFDDELIRTWAKYWIEPLHAMQSMREECLTIRYEEMIQNQAEVLNRVFEFLGVDANHEIAESAAENARFEKMTGRPQGVAVHTAKARKGIVGDWKNFFTRRDGQLFHELAGPCLERLGHVSGPDWYKSLPETLEFSQSEAS